MIYGIQKHKACLIIKALLPCRLAIENLQDMAKYFFLREFLKVQAIGWPIYMMITVLINYHTSKSDFVLKMALGLLMLFVVFNACVAVLYLIIMTRWGGLGLLLLILLYWGSAEWILNYSQLHIGFDKASVGKYSAIGMDNSYYWRMLNRYINVLFFAIATVLYIKSKKNAKLKELEIARRHHKELEAAENKIAFLTSQINPHFLYNVLTHIKSGIIELQPDKALTVDQLAELMRYNLSAGMSRSGKVLLKKEIAALQMYIELEKSRFEQCYITLNIEGEDHWHKLPPGSLLTLLENAFKHGVHSEINHPIQAHLTLHEEVIEFTCINKIVRNKYKYESTGLGLQNLKQRLELLFPERYTLEYGEEDNQYFKVKLLIKQN